MSRILTNEEHRKILLSIPWIKVLKTPVPCEGFKANTPLKAIFSMGGKPPVGRERYACKNKARYRYRFLKSKYIGNTDTQSLCWSHLMSRGIGGDMDEEARVKRWLTRHGYMDEKGWV